MTVNTGKNQIWMFSTLNFIQCTILFNRLYTSPGSYLWLISLIFAMLENNDFYLLVPERLSALKIPENVLQPLSSSDDMSARMWQPHTDAGEGVWRWARAKNVGRTSENRVEFIKRRSCKWKTGITITINFRVPFEALAFPYWAGSEFHCLLQCFDPAINSLVTLS